MHSEDYFQQTCAEKPKGAFWRFIEKLAEYPDEPSRMSAWSLVLIGGGLTGLGAIWGLGWLIATAIKAVGWDG